MKTKTILQTTLLVLLSLALTSCLSTLGSVTADTSLIRGTMHNVDAIAEDLRKAESQWAASLWHDACTLEKNASIV